MLITLLKCLLSGLCVERAHAEPEQGFSKDLKLVCRTQRRRWASCTRARALD